jgi:hypothetical protein
MAITYTQDIFYLFLKKVFINIWPFYLKSVFLKRFLGIQFDFQVESDYTNYLDVINYG